MSNVAGSTISGSIVQIDEEQVRGHVDEVVRRSVEETLNGLLEAEADQLCGAQRYERSPDRADTRAGSYERKLQTKAGQVTLKFRGCGVCRLKRRSSSGIGGGNRASRKP